MIAPSNVGVKRNSQFAPTRNTINGFDPAGGCGTRNNCIADNAVAKDKAMLHHSGLTKCRNTKPVNVDIKWPPTTLRGCANGVSGSMNRTNIDAPKDPKTNGCLVKYAKKPTAAAAKKAPSQINPTCFIGGDGGTAADNPLNF